MSKYRRGSWGDRCFYHMVTFARGNFQTNATMAERSERRINVMLKNYKYENKSQSTLFSLSNFPIFCNVVNLKRYLVEKHSEEILPAKDIHSFDIGYFGAKGRKLSICTERHLQDAYSTESANYVTFWMKPLCQQSNETVQRQRKRPAQSATITVEDNADESAMCLEFKAPKGKKQKNVNTLQDDQFNQCLSRLRTNHSHLADFKLKCWARMLVNGSHRDEVVPPNVPFFAVEHGKNNNPAVTTTADSGYSTASAKIDTTENKMKARGMILQQLGELKALKDILSTEEFEEQKQKILEDLKKL